MVLSIITLAATVPLLATSTIQLQDQSQKTKDDQELNLKTEKLGLRARASPRMSERRQEQFRDTIVVLANGRLYLEKPGQSSKHHFAGYFLPYPQRGFDGLVSTIDADNMLNWIYVDTDTYEVRYGVRTEAQQHLTGPTSMVPAEDEWRIAFEGWEGFVAVEEEKGVWMICFDRDDNGLTHIRRGRPVVEIELARSILDNGHRDGPPSS